MEGTVERTICRLVGWLVGSVAGWMGGWVGGWVAWFVVVFWLVTSFTLHVGWLIDWCLWCFAGLLRFHKNIQESFPS